MKDISIIIVAVLMAAGMVFTGVLTIDMRQSQKNMSKDIVMLKDAVSEIWDVKNELIIIDDMLTAKDNNTDVDF